MNHNHEAAAMHEQTAPDLEYTPITSPLPELVRAVELETARVELGAVRYQLMVSRQLSALHRSHAETHERIWREAETLRQQEGVKAAADLASLRERAAALEAAIWKNCRDWDNAPAAAEWWAVGADGSAWFYAGEPRIQARAWGGMAVSGSWPAGFVPLAAMGLDWRDTLTARPEATAP